MTDVLDPSRFVASEPPVNGSSTNVSNADTGRRRPAEFDSWEERERREHLRDQELYDERFQQILEYVEHDRAEPSFSPKLDFRDDGSAVSLGPTVRWAVFASIMGAYMAIDMVKHKFGLPHTGVGDKMALAGASAAASRDVIVLRLTPFLDRNVLPLLNPTVIMHARKAWESERMQPLRRWIRHRVMNPIGTQWRHLKIGGATPRRKLVSQTLFAASAFLGVAAITGAFSPAIGGLALGYGVMGACSAGRHNRKMYRDHSGVPPTRLRRLRTNLNQRFDRGFGHARIMVIGDGDHYLPRRIVGCIFGLGYGLGHALRRRRHDDAQFENELGLYERFMERLRKRAGVEVVDPPPVWLPKDPGNSLWLLLGKRGPYKELSVDQAHEWANEILDIEIDGPNSRSIAGVSISDADREIEDLRLELVAAIRRTTIEDRKTGKLFTVQEDGEQVGPDSLMAAVLAIEKKLEARAQTAGAIGPTIKLEFLEKICPDAVRYFKAVEICDEAAQDDSESRRKEQLDHWKLFRDAAKRTGKAAAASTALTGTVVGGLVSSAPLPEPVHRVDTSDVREAKPRVGERYFGERNDRLYAPRDPVQSSENKWKRKIQLAHTQVRNSTLNSNSSPEVAKNLRASQIDAVEAAIQMGKKEMAYSLATDYNWAQNVGPKRNPVLGAKVEDVVTRWLHSKVSDDAALKVVNQAQATSLTVSNASNSKNHPSMNRHQDLEPSL